MEDNRINILLIEDNPGDARLIEVMLAESTAMKSHLAWCADLASGLAHLTSNVIDILLLDLGLPECSGLDTLKVLQAELPKIPALVVLSGLLDEDVALRAVQSGAQDYLVKGKIDTALLVRSIRYALERNQTEEALREAHAELENRVQERTAELASAVAALKAEIAERKLAEEHIQYMAHYDALTGLPNRVLLQDRLVQAIAHAYRKKSQVAVLFLDLDYFKHVNDSLGHQMGDRLLKAVADRLQECLREGDSLSRLGGDEFVLCLTMLAGSIDAASVAKKVQDELNRPFTIDGNLMHVSASIGISLYPDDGKTAEALMSAADTAMCQAKKIGRRNYQFFTQALNKAVQDRVEQEQLLRLALLRDELELHYQPQVDLESGEIFSAEALLRWCQPGKSATSCSTFIAVAEETGLILSLGEWTLRQACRQLKQWQDAGHVSMRVAVNLSPRQFYQDGFQQNIRDIVISSGVLPSTVDLEITEGILLQRNEDNLAKLHQLSEMGIQLSVDDFGTGYSSLAYLQRFPVDGLKIDQSFVRSINQDPGATALVIAIISMARSLNLKVLAEGVETEEQIRFLRSHGCRYGQGFFYSKAVPGNQLLQLLSNQSRRSGRL
ncbi:two-component system response regulator [Noviherbaspirillum sp.]|uniref:two-component system response regulator n=1 Tax=Noviherbaspirillum sp. TaxID=1926288 RepID=UPI002FE3D691